MCIFSLITANITSMKTKSSIAEVFKKKKEEIQMFIYDMDKTLPTKLENSTYDTSIEYISTSYLHGISKSLKEGYFY